MPLSCTINELLSFIFLNVKRSRDSEHILLGIIYSACTSTPVCQSARVIWIAYLRQLQRHDWEKI